MAETQEIKEKQVEQLKAEIRSRRADNNRLGNMDLCREELLTFDMLERYPLVTDQSEYTFRWHLVDALYQFVERIPAWVVDDEIMDVWKSGVEDHPQSFKRWKTTHPEYGQALLLSWAHACIDNGATSRAKVFSAVVVCVHPYQTLMSIRQGANDLINWSIKWPKKCMSAFCQLPRRSAKTFYPSPLNNSYLVLPFFCLRGEPRKVRLDTPINFNRCLVARRLHRRQTPGGDEAVLPPVFSKDPSVPGTLQVGYMGPMWLNTKYTSTVPTGGAGLLSETEPQPSITEVAFCADEVQAHKSLAPMDGASVVYSPEWYDESGKFCPDRGRKPKIKDDEATPSPAKPKATPSPAKPKGPARISSDGEGDNKSGEEEAAASGHESDVSGSGESNKSDQASNSDPGAGSDAGSGKSEFGSGSEDSSKSSRSSSGGASSKAESDGDSDGINRQKVLRRKKSRRSGSESEGKPKDTQSGDDAKGDGTEPESRDSGVGDGVTPMVSSGDGAAAVVGMKFIAGAPRKGALPAPTTLPPMAALRTLTDDLEALSDKMFQDLEEVNLQVYNKVLKGFKDTGGKCRTFIQEMGALVVAFLAKAERLEDELAKPDAVAFAEAMEASKTHVLRLIQEVAEAEDIHDRGEARFNKIVASVADEVEEYIRNQGGAQRKKYIYKTDCLDRIERDHGRLDGACFVPMIIGNLTAHRALCMSMRVAQSHVPLHIMLAPMRTQAGAVKACTKFVEYLARRVIALHEKLGPGTTGVPLESDPQNQSLLSKGRHSSSPSPTRNTTPPAGRSSPVRSQPNSPTRAKLADVASAPDNNQSVFSPHSTNILSLWDKMDVPDDETPSESEDDHRQTPKLAPGKRAHCSSDKEAKGSSKKKSKVDVSNLYGSVVSEGANKDGKAGMSTPKKAKKKKHHKDKHDREKDKDKRKSTALAEQKVSKDEGKKTPTPKKASSKAKSDQSEGEDSDNPPAGKSKKKVRTRAECRADKWEQDLESVTRYRQRMDISVHTLAEGRNFADHTDYVNQLMRKSGTVNIKSLDDRIGGLKVLTSPYHSKLHTELTKWKGKEMGNSGVKPQYVVKAFVEPGSERKITSKHTDHWHSDLMLGLYNVHKYDAISKENMQWADETKPSALGFCATCSYASGNHQSINNHIRAHYRLLLECGHSRCAFVHADCKEMYRHGITKHQHTKEAADNA